MSFFRLNFDFNGPIFVEALICGGLIIFLLLISRPVQLNASLTETSSCGFTVEDSEGERMNYEQRIWTLVKTLFSLSRRGEIESENTHVCVV